MKDNLKTVLLHTVKGRPYEKTKKLRLMSGVVAQGSTIQLAKDQLPFVVENFKVLRVASDSIHVQKV